MAYKRFLCKYHIIENVFTVTTVSVDNLKARLYPTESLLHNEPVVTQRCECSRKVTTILPWNWLRKKQAGRNMHKSYNNRILLYWKSKFPIPHSTLKNYSRKKVIIKFCNFLSMKAHSQVWDNYWQLKAL